VPDVCHGKQNKCGGGDNPLRDGQHRIHLESIFSRDTGGFRSVREVRAKMYPLRYAESRSDKAIGRNPPYPGGFPTFSRPAALRLVAVPQGYGFRGKPCGIGKRSETRLEAYF